MTMRTRCDTAALAAKRAETTSALRRFVGRNVADSYAAMMASDMEHMRGRPEHHVIQALMSRGYRASEIVVGIDAVMASIGRER
jgi:hypothetical protein